MSSHLFTLIGGLVALSIFLFFLVTVLRSKQAGNKKARKKVEKIKDKLTSSKNS